MEATGREIGHELAPEDDPGSAQEKVHQAGRLSYRLCNCPYRQAVRESQEIVCTLHRGMTRGLLESVSPNTKLAAFVPRDPYAAGCLIELHGELADQALAAVPDRS